MERVEDLYIPITDHFFILLQSGSCCDFMVLLLDLLLHISVLSDFAHRSQLGESYKLSKPIAA